MTTATANTAPVFNYGATGYVSSTSLPNALRLMPLPDGGFAAMAWSQFQAFAPDGSLDTQQFPAQLTVPVSNGSGFVEDALRLDHGLAVAMQLTVQGAYQIGVAELRPDFSLDPAFGSKGMAMVSLPVAATWMGRGEISAMPGGGYLVKMDYQTKDGAENHSMLTRVTAQGTVVSSFGRDGVWQTENNVWIHSIAVQESGKILLGLNGLYGGSALARLNADGTADADFGIGGKIRLADYDYGTPSVALQPDGKIVTMATVQYGHSAEITRYDKDGHLDFDFGIGGKVFLTIQPDYGPGTPGSSQLTGSSLLVAPDGTITFLGQVFSDHTDAHPGQVVAARLRPDGRLDTQFGQDGILHFSSPDPQNKQLSFPNAIVDAAGRIVIEAGAWPSGGGGTVPVYFRLDGDGLDETFGTPAPASHAAAQYRLEQPSMPLAPLLGVHDAQLDASRTNYAGAVLTLARQTGVSPLDLYSGSGAVAFADGAVLVDGAAIGSVSLQSGKLTVTFNARATAALVNQVLQSVRFESGAPLTAGDTLKLLWTFNDGNAGLQGAGGAAQAKFVSELSVMRPALAYWVDGLLGRASPGQSAALFQLEQQLLLSGQKLSLSFGGGFSADQMQIMRDSLSAAAAVAGLTVGSGGLTIAVSKAADGHAYGTLMSAHGATIHLGGSETGLALRDTFLSELAHTLGLKTPAEDGGDGRALPAIDNQAGTTVLSDGVGAGQLGILDIAALQYLYGPNPAARTGNDTYLLNPDTANFVWDGAGTDTVSAAGLAAPVTLHLDPGHWDYIGTRGASITAAGQVTVNYGTRIENAIGGDGQDHLTGTGSANRLSGGGGNDWLDGNGGGDVLDGGSGIDTAHYAGRIAAATVSTSGAAATVTTSAGRDQLTSVERLSFDDGALALDIDGHAGQLFRLYQATFGRAADPAGLGYYIAQLDAGAALADVAADFLRSPEYASRFGANLDNGAFLTALYRNVLHRAPDESGFAFWKDKLDTHAADQTLVLMQFSDSPENQAQVIGTISHGIAYVPYG